MIKIYVNNTDITASVQFGSVQITEQLNNRRNTARFIVNETEISEAQKIEIYKGSKLSSNISAGVSSFVLDELFEKWEFLRVWDQVLLDIETSEEELLTIDTIDPITKTISFTLPTRYAHVKGDFCGKKVFAGVTLKNPREEIGKSDILTYQVDCVDLSTIYDTHNVVDTFADMYAREILSRIVYKYTAPDASVEISDMESLTGLTASGVAVTPVLDTADKIYKNNSIQIGSSGAWDAIYTFAFSAIDLSQMDNLRYWLKFPSNTSNWITGIRTRLISSAGNLYEWTDGLLFDKVWSFDSFSIQRATKTGSPNLASITSVEITLFATKAIPVGTFKLDHLYCTRGGFTLRGVERGNIFFRDVRAQYKKPTVLTEALSKNDGYTWYVDVFGDLRYFSNENRLAPFSIIAPTGLNYDKLKITADITNLKNRVVVRGGIAPSGFLYTQEKVLDGQETSYRLDYPPKWLNVYLDTGGGYVLKTVWVENLVSDTSVDFVFNFSEKTVRNGAIGVQTAGTKIKLEYYPYKDVRVSAQDDVSIASMKTLLGGDGIFDGPVINDASLRTFDEARARARAELKAYANPVLTATFTTEVDGLEAWQTIRITDPTFDIDQDFVVQKVDKKIRDISGVFLYSIQAGTTLYWLTEFFQYLLKQYGTGEIDSAELVDRVQAIDDIVVIWDSVQITKKSNLFFATPEVPYETLQIWETAYYPLDGNGNDVTGNGNNASNLFGNVTFWEDANWTFADINGDRNYTAGTGTYANLGIGNKMNFTQATDFSWNVAFSLLSSPPNNASWVFGSNFDNALYITNTSGAMTLALRGSTFVSIWVWSNYWATRYGEVHTVGFAYKASEAKFYVYLDGVLQNIGGTAWPATFLCNDWSIGDYWYWSGNPSSCRKKVYQARVYNKFLTDREFLFLAKNINYEKEDHHDTNSKFTWNLRFGGYWLTAVSGSSLEQTDYFSDTNSAYSFDGNDLVTQNNFFTGMAQEFSMWIMVYPTSIAGGISNRFIISTNDRLGVAFNTTGKFEAYVYDTNYRILNITDTPVLNDWTHVGVSYKNNTLKIFLNGILKGSLAVTWPIVAWTNTYIGNWTSLGQWFRGKLDEWEFETTARDDAGMLEMAQRCFTGNDAYADFCEAS